MRFTTLPATALLGAALLASGAIAGTAWAQANQSPEQILKSLTPTAVDGPNRGVRIAKPGPGGSTTAAPPEANPSASLNVLFATGSAQLTPAVTKTLENLGKALTDPKIANSKFRVEGHTDTVGTPEVNKALSAQRAQAVTDYLAMQFHIDRAKLEPVGLGQDGLLVPTPAQTPEARNRRVVVVNLGG